jgi:hypothetical protein
MTFFFSSLLTFLLTSLFLFSRCKGRSVDNHIHLIISSVFVIIVTTRSSITTTTRIMNHGHSDECRRYGLRISTSTTSICQLIHKKFPSSLGIIVDCGQEKNRNFYFEERRLFGWDDRGHRKTKYGRGKKRASSSLGIIVGRLRTSESWFTRSVFLQILNGGFSHVGGFNANNNVRT